MNSIRVALAGQPNCGKSTIFNMVSGIEQHIANYPGVTVDKKIGFFDYEDNEIEMIDLPGTYSFSSYSLEEKVAKDFVVDESPDVIVNVVDASNIKRNLYLTFQLLEIGIPVVIVLNMMDVAQRRGIEIDSAKMSSLLNCPVIEASGAKGLGKEEIMKSIVNTFHNKKNYETFKINYQEVEEYINNIEEKIKEFHTTLNKRWFAIKLLEKDYTIFDRIKEHSSLDFDLDKFLKEKESDFMDRYKRDVVSLFAAMRFDAASLIFSKCVKEKNLGKETITDKIDKIVLNRYLALPILIFFMFLIYEISIVGGYKLTDYTWPIFATFKNFVIGILPPANLIEVPLITNFGIWMVNSANALMNYIPIFFLLFALIAIMEDVGYMPRMAFILDRVFRKFGLHGQSTLPLVLGGAMVGGCAVPGVMATKGIADDRARMATILSVPYMNCLAKVPFYTLLLGAFFKPDMALMMFYISTITIFVAMIVAKALTSTILKTKETAPFLMELPPYHLPTFRGVIIRASQRVWLYIKKVVTIVLAVAVVLFAMLQFPGISKESQEKYNLQIEKALDSFYKKNENNKYLSSFDSKDEISSLLNYYENYRSKKMIASGDAGKKIDDDFMKENPEFFKFLKPDKNDKDAKDVNKTLRALSNDAKKILREIQNEKIENSLLGKIGRGVEPITRFAGFDWKINVAFLSSFAARESAVATLGSIYENNKADDMRAEEAMALNSGYTPLHAVSIIIFMILTPPCIATMIVVKMQTNSYRWMLFAIFFPIVLGIVVCSMIFTLSSMYGLSGVEAMTYFYFLLVLIALSIAFFPNKIKSWSGGQLKSI